MKNGANLPHLNYIQNFRGIEVGNGELTEDLYRVGKYYLIDTGCIQNINETDYE